MVGVKITILRHIGGVEAVVAENCETANCALGEFQIHWDSSDPTRAKPRYGEVSIYSKHYTSFAKFLSKKGIKVREGEDIQIGLYDDDKARLVQALRAQFAAFKEAFLRGEIRLYAHQFRETGEWRWTVKEKDWHGLKAFNALWAMFWTYFMTEWCPKGVQDGEDITEKVVEEYKRRVKMREEGTEPTIMTDMDYVTCVGCGRRFTYEEAKRIGFDFATRYCGC
jgi:hypothetical protein